MYTAVIKYRQQCLAAAFIFILVTRAPFPGRFCWITHDGYLFICPIADDKSRKESATGGPSIRTNMTRKRRSSWSSSSSSVSSEASSSESSSLSLQFPWTPPLEAFDFKRAQRFDLLSLTMCIQPNDVSKFYLRTVSTNANYYNNTQTEVKLFKFKVAKGDTCEGWEVMFRNGVARARQREHHRLILACSMATDQPFAATEFEDMKRSIKDERDKLSKMLLVRNGRLLPEDLFNS